MGVPVRDRPGRWPDARRGAVLRAVPLAIPGERTSDRFPRRFDESMWCGRDRRPAPGHRADGRDVLAEGRGTAPQDRPGDHRPVRRQPAGDRPIPLPQRQVLHAPGRQPQQAHAFLDRLVEIHLANLERFLGAVGPYIDIILFGDDLGMQTGPQISPAMYREFFKPRHAGCGGGRKNWPTSR